MRKSLTRRRLAAAAVASVASAALLLSACSSDTPSTTPSAAPVAGGTLRVDLSAQANCLDPAVAFTADERVIVRPLADSLVSLDRETGEITPWLAESWDLSADGLSYTFHLKDGVTFGDGTPLTADAVKSTFDYLVANLGSTSTRGAGYLRDYAGTEVLDPHTARVDFKAPAPQFLPGATTNTLAILSPASASKTPAQRCAGDFVGSGPFTLKSSTQGQGASLVKRAGYGWAPPTMKHEGDAYLDGIDFQVVRVSSVRDHALQSGQTDVAVDLATGDLQQLKNAGVTPMSGTLPGMPVSFVVNSASPGLSDPAVYAAIRTGFDRGGAVKAVLGDYFAPATSALTHNLPQYKDESDSLTFDADAAKKKLDAAGWVVGSDGVRVKNGQRLDYTVAYTSTFGAHYTAILQSFQQQMKGIGIAITLSDRTRSGLLDSVAHHSDDLYVTSVTDVDPDVIRSSVSPILDATTLQSSGVAALFDRSTKENDAAQRTALFAQIQDLLIGKGMIIPLWEDAQLIGHTSRVKGLGLDSLSGPTFYDTSLAD